MLASRADRHAALTSVRCRARRTNVASLLLSAAPLYLGDDCQPREPSLPGDPAVGKRVLEVADRIIAERAELQLKGASRPPASRKSHDWCLPTSRPAMV